MSTKPVGVQAQLRSRNGHHEFEHLCREIARVCITPNILPATGPVSAGGDHGRDFETFRTFIQERVPGSFLAAEADVRIVFACTLQQKKLDAKIRNDLKKITDGGPADQVYFFCEQDIPVARRHELCKHARDSHAVGIEIIDGQALAELLAADNRLRAAAERYLGVAFSSRQPGGVPRDELACVPASVITGTSIHGPVIYGDVNIYHAEAPAPGAQTAGPADPADDDDGTVPRHGTRIRRRTIIAAAGAAAAGLLAAARPALSPSARPGLTPPVRRQPSAPVPARTPLWTYPTGHTINCTPVVADGTVFFGNDNGEVFALDAATGVRRWVHSAGPREVWSRPVLAGRTLYVASNGGGLCALDARHGHLLWTYPAAGSVVSGLTAADGIVYFGGTDHRIYAIDTATRLPRWTYPTGGSVKSTPAVAGGTLYVGSYDHCIYALEAATGHQLWRTPTRSIVLSSPAVAGRVVYVGGYDSNMYALDTASGSINWTHAAGGPIWFSSPAVTSATVYIGSRDHSVYALDTASGNPRWIISLGAEIKASPALAAGTIYINSHDRLYALEASTGTLRWTFAAEGGFSASPAVATGMLCIGSDNGQLYAFSTAPAT